MSSSEQQPPVRPLRIAVVQMPSRLGTIAENPERARRPAEAARPRAAASGPAPEAAAVSVAEAPRGGRRRGRIAVALPQLAAAVVLRFGEHRLEVARDAVSLRAERGGEIACVIVVKSVRTLAMLANRRVPKRPATSVVRTSVSMPRAAPKTTTNATTPTAPGTSSRMRSATGAPA